MSEYHFYLYHKDLGHYTRIKDPEGWDALGKRIRRFGLDGTVGLRWHGVFFEYNIRLKFIKDGKAFIQSYYEKYGIEQEILLRIDKRDSFTRKFEKDYEGRLNLTSYHISTIYVECNVENTGFLQKLKNRQDVKVNLGSLVSQGGVALTAFSQETQNITLHSKAITELYTGNIRQFSGFIDVNVNQYMQFDFVNDISEIDTKYIYSNAGNLANRPPEAFEIVRAGSYTFDVRLAIAQFIGAGNTSLLKIYLQKNEEAPIEFSIESSCLDSTIYYEIRTVNHTFTCLSGDRLFWHCKNIDSVSHSVELRPGGESFPGSCYLADKKTYVKVTALTTTPATICKTVMIHEAWTRMVQSITDRKDTGVFYSDYYGRTDIGYAADGAGALRGITNGFQVRGINNPIYATSKEMIDSCLAIDGIGFGIEVVNGAQRIRVEPLTYWYQTKRMMRLDYVLDIEKNVEPELYFNTIEGGIDKWKNNRASNLDEPNAKKEWTAPISQIKKALPLKCPYITSGYTLEYARRETDASKDNTSAGTDVDNSNFIIQLRRNGGNFDPDKNQDFTSVTGIVDSATAYNLKLSPRRCLAKNGRFIRASLEKYKDQNINFSFGEANNGMSSQLTSETSAVVENGNILISLLDKPLFLAEAYKIRAKLTRAQILALSNTDPASSENVWGYVEFSETNGNYKRGYLLDAQVAADSNEVKLQLIKAAI